MISWHEEMHNYLLVLWISLGPVFDFEIKYHPPFAALFQVQTFRQHAYFHLVVVDGAMSKRRSFRCGNRTMTHCPS